MATNLLDVRLEVPKGGLSDKEVKSVSNDLTRRAGQVVAEVARRRMAEQISPGHKYNVGASGRAAANLKVELMDRKVGFVSWAVVEGDETPANAAIRYGIQPGNAPSIEKLREWAAMKGITLRAPGGRESRVGQVRSYVQKRRGRQVQVRGYARTVRGSGETTREALQAIRYALLTRGTNRPTANWWRLYPSGQGRFDYVAWTVKQEKYFYDAVQRASEDAARGIVSYLASGKRPDGYRVFNVR